MTIMNATINNKTANGEENYWETQGAFDPK
jgi:hypothetical protein